MRLLTIGIAAAMVLPLQAELGVKKIELMVKQIQGKRVSPREVDFPKTPSPFVVVVSQDENHTAVQLQAPEKAVQFSLSAIINARAHINGHWVKSGESVEGYRVEEIKPNEVFLKKGDREVHLFLPRQKKENLLQISEG